MSVFIGSTTQSQRNCLSKEFKKLYAKKTFIPRKQKIAIALNTCDVGIKGVGDKEYDRIIHEINSKNGVSYENQGWFALANKKSNSYYIEFQKGYWTFTQKDDVMRFYKNKESFAKRVSELIRKGF